MKWEDGDYIDLQNGEGVTLARVVYSSANDYWYGRTVEDAVLDAQCFRRIIDILDELNTGCSPQNVLRNPQRLS